MSTLNFKTPGVQLSEVRDMNEKDKAFDDHHCSVIERENVKVEMDACDSNSDSREEREKCQDEVKEASRKRERACKFS